jgi:cell filamentation protein, protein adenylyltransferase
MYDAAPDPYCYPGTTVLKNLADLRDQVALDKFESTMTAQRADEPLPRGRLGVAHYRAIHRHLFKDVYAWAGQFRQVRLSKDGSAFCYPENIESEMKRLFGDLARNRQLANLSQQEFAAEGAAFLSTLNAIHPFREGNGRTQTAFLVLLAKRAGHPIDLDRVQPEAFLDAMIASFKGDDTPLERQIRLLTSS